MGVLASYLAFSYIAHGRLSLHLNSEQIANFVQLVPLYKINRLRPGLEIRICQDRTEDISLHQR
jgi:hypothetical protein